MNEKAIVKHFQGIYTGDRTYLCARVSDCYLVAEGFIVLRLPVEHFLFDSRRVFPSFPDSGQTLTYLRGREPELAETCLATAFTRWVNNPEATEAELTSWLKESGDMLARTFLLSEGRRVFINNDFVELLNGKNDVLEKYQWFVEPPTEDEAKTPMIAHLGGEAVAGLMPMKVYEQAPLFPLG